MHQALSTLSSLGRLHLALHSHSHRHRDSAFRLAAVTASLIFHYLRGPVLQGSVHKPPLSGRERRAEAGRTEVPFAYQPRALPLSETGSLTMCMHPHQFEKKSVRGILRSGIPALPSQIHFPVCL